MTQEEHRIEKTRLDVRPLRIMWFGIFAILCLPATIVPHSSLFVVEANEHDGLGRKLEVQLLGETKYNECVENLLSATSQFDYVFEVPAYLKFIEYQSNGLITRSKFDVGILELVHIYWLVVCTVSSDMCYRDTSVPVQDVMEFEESDGSLLIDKLCNRVDLYLERNGFTTYEPSAAFESIPSPPSISSTGPPMHMPNNILHDMASEKPTMGMNLVPTVPSSGPTNLVSRPPTGRPSSVATSQNFGLTSSTPTPISVSEDFIVELGPYSFVFNAICLERAFYQSAKTKSLLRSVFYDQSMNKIKEKLSCTSSWCRYEIFLIASFDSFAFDFVEAKVKVSVSNSVYVKPLDPETDKSLTASLIEQAINDLMLSNQLGDLLTMSTQCESPSLSPAKHSSFSPTVPNEQCVQNLEQAVSSQGNLYTKDAFLQFVALESKGSFKENEFNDSIRGLVQIYWWTICTIENDECTENSIVDLEDIIAGIDDDGARVIALLCQKVQDYLKQSILSHVPSNIPSASYSATDSPTNTPSYSQMTTAPSIIIHAPTTAPSTLPSIATSSLPSINSNVPSHIPSSGPSSSPTNKYERCISNLIDVATSSGAELSQDAFMRFVGVYSGGALDIPSSAASPVQITQIYWFAVCSVLGETNCNEGSTITFAELLSFEFADGSRLVHETCESVDDYLFVHVFTRQPSSSPTSVPSSTVHPSGYPSRAPSVGPTVSDAPSVSSAPSVYPTVPPTWSLHPSMSIKPSQVPSLRATEYPSMSPSHSAMPTLEPSLFPSNVASNAPSSSSAPTIHPSMTSSIVPSIRTSSSPSSQSLFQLSFSIEYLSQCVNEVIYAYVNAAVKDYLNCSSIQNCSITYSLLLNLIPFVCLDQVITGSEHSCALVDLSFNVSFPSEVDPIIKDELLAVVQAAVQSYDLDLLINTESSCTPSSFPSSSIAPTSNPTLTPSNAPSVTASLVPSRMLTSAPTYGDSISLYFSIEYLVDDVKKVLEDSLNSIVSRVIDNENICNNNSTQCKNPSYSLTISVFQRRQCLAPVDTFHKCAFVDLILILKSEDPLDSLRETLTNAIKKGLSDGSIDTLINTPSS